MVNHKKSVNFPSSYLDDRRCRKKISYIKKYRNFTRLWNLRLRYYAKL